MPSARSSRQPTISRTPVAPAASQARDAGKAVTIDNAKRLDAKFGRRGEELVIARSTAQEREVAGDLEFGIAHQP